MIKLIKEIKEGEEEEEKNKFKLVIKEINELFKSTDKQYKFITKIISKYYTIKEKCFWRKAYKSTRGGSNASILFSPRTSVKDYINKEYNIKMPLDYKIDKFYHSFTGIEIMYELHKFNSRNYSKKYDKNGKCIQHYYTNKQLKGFCKMNGLKGYNSMKKLQLLKALMSV